MSSTTITTTVTAKLPHREGEFSFSRASIVKVDDGRLVVKLTDDEGHALDINFRGSELKRLISWRLLMGL
jgi:hypothetical protein